MLRSLQKLQTIPQENLPFRSNGKKYEEIPQFYPHPLNTAPNASVYMTVKMLLIDFEKNENHSLNRCNEK